MNVRGRAGGFAGGFAWARADRSEVRWRVLARDGTFVGWVDVPEAIAVLDITDDRLLAVRLNDFDVPAVVMMELLEE